MSKTILIPADGMRPDGLQRPCESKSARGDR